MQNIIDMTVKEDDAPVINILQVHLSKYVFRKTCSIGFLFMIIF